MDCMLPEKQDDESEIDSTSEISSKDALGGVNFTVTAETIHSSAVDKAELP